MNIINPKNIRYIKLGEQGRWEESCINDSTIRLGYESHLHTESISKQWDLVREFWLKERNGDVGTTTRDINQIRDFYELSENDIWITFHKRKLYWCQAKAEVTELSDRSRIRKTIEPWSCKDKNGKELKIENLDGRLTKVQGFRGTICGVQMNDYLIRKINGEKISEVEETKSNLIKLKTNISHLIKGLWWHDFELLVELVFSKSGWQRYSVLGKTEKDLDLDLYSPITKKRAFVQIKSSTDFSAFTKYVETFKNYNQFQEMYYVYHTSIDHQKNIITNEAENIFTLDCDDIAELVITTGLIDWLIEKRS